MKATGLWDDETFLRQVIPPEEDRGRNYPCAEPVEPRWFRSPNVIPIERHQRFKPPINPGSDNGHNVAS